MQLQQAVQLINHADISTKTIWADLGCGDGLFTNALLQLTPHESLIYAVDKSKSALKNVAVRDNVQLQKINLDFVKDELPFTNLSAILMANAFHFVWHKKVLINKLLNCFNKPAYFLIVEYDTDKSNLWVPYPLSYLSLKSFFEELDFSIEKLHELPSKYNGVIYSAIVKDKQACLI